MSLFPLDLDRYKRWTIEQLYYLLFPYIKEDFMGRSDCRNVHAEGNMQAIVSGAAGTVTHIIRGGDDTVISIKDAEYRIRLEEGRVTLQSAQEQGQFTG